MAMRSSIATLAKPSSPQNMRAADVTRIEANASHTLKGTTMRTVTPRAIRVARAYLGMEVEYKRTLQDRPSTVALAMLLDSFAACRIAEFQKISSAKSLDNVLNPHA
jgi:hypothetical protein